MFDRLHRTHHMSHRREHGQALLFLLAVLGLATGMFVYSAVRNVSLTAASDNTTALALADARAALISYAVATGDSGLNYTGSNARPGEFPCPDTNNDGFDNDGSCSAGRVGRLPWRTLGIPEPKDTSGETLWYAVSGNFRRYNASTTPITSNTLGTMTVYANNADSTAMQVTTQAVAVIFAPGAAIGTQLRDTTSASCSTTGTTIANNLCAANYLDSTAGSGSTTVNNATNNGPFINYTPPASTTTATTYNDRLLVITTADFMPLVEQRVAREMMAILQSYRAQTGVYPWADLGDGSSNDGSIGGYNRSRFPCDNSKPTDWGNSGTPVLPKWLQNGCTSITGWNNAIYYAVAKNKLQSSGSSCGTCSGSSSLTVNNTGSYIADLCLNSSSPFKCNATAISSGSADLVLMTPGPTTSASRGSWSSSSLGTTITGYFDDSENRDNNDDTFVVPTATSLPTAAVFDRDRIYIVR